MEQALELSRLVLWDLNPALSFTTVITLGKLNFELYLPNVNALLCKAVVVKMSQNNAWHILDMAGREDSLQHPFERL